MPHTYLQYPNAEYPVAVRETERRNIKRFIEACAKDTKICNLPKIIPSTRKLRAQRFYGIIPTYRYMIANCDLLDRL